jgi:hypothetical protein
MPAPSPWEQRVLFIGPEASRVQGACLADPQPGNARRGPEKLFMFRTCVCVVNEAPKPTTRLAIAQAKQQEAREQGGRGP